MALKHDLVILHEDKAGKAKDTIPNPQHNWHHLAISLLLSSWTIQQGEI